MAADHSSSDHDSLIESVKEKISDTFHHQDSSSDSDNEFSADAVKNKIYRIFGREKPLHKVLGGGKAADIFLWRDKKVTAGVVGVATAIWVLFELLEYHLLTLVCHLLIVGFVGIFAWSRGCTLIKKSTPKIPEVVLPEDIVLDVAAAFRVEINRAFSVIREISLGRDLKKFLGVIAGLWILSVLGNSFNFLTLFYLSFLLLHTLPVLYEKYDDKVDAFAEKAEAEIKKQYAVFNAKVLTKVPLGPLKAMTSSNVEMEKREEQKLKHLGFMRVMATNSIVLVLNLYNFAKNNSGPLKSTVGTVEIAVSTVFSPFYELFKGLPDDVLIFVDNKVDEATNKFDKSAPPLVKKAVRSVHAIVEKVSNPAKHFVHFVREAQARGPKAAISHAGALSKHVAMSFAVSKLALAWYKIDHQPTLHGFASIALPTAAHFLEKYNMIIVDLTAKGYPIFGFLPSVPVEDIVKAYKQVKAGVAKEENTT